MWRLVDAEIWRDGGSYSVVIADSSQTLALWLQVNAWNQLSERSYGALHVSSGPDPTRKTRTILGSEEPKWLALLSEQTDTTNASDFARECLGEVVTILRERAAV